MLLIFVLFIDPVTCTVNDDLAEIKEIQSTTKEIQWSKGVIRVIGDMRRIVRKWTTLTSRDRSNRLDAPVVPHCCQNEPSERQEVLLLVRVVPHGKKCDMWHQLTARMLHNVQLQRITWTRKMTFQWYCIIFCSLSIFLFTNVLHVTNMID